VFNKKEEKDERAVSIEHASYALAIKVVGFALLIDVIYRSIVLKQAAWDLLGIVILGGLVATLYQTHFKTTTRSWVKASLLTVLAAILVAVVIVLFLK
jgi:hypothetical protein